MTAEYDVVKTDEEWRDALTPEQFQVLRKAGTEPAFTGKYWDVHDDGTYACAACGAGLFASDAKFDSGTGWPSFSEVVPGSVELKRDFRGGIPRTEALCRRCGGHLGHLFHDGPGPDRSRYCINSCALTLDEADADASDDGLLQ